MRVCGVGAGALQGMYQQRQSPGGERKHSSIRELRKLGKASAREGGAAVSLAPWGVPERF